MNLVLNQARCRRCGIVVRSALYDEAQQCRCGRLVVWGGLEEAGRPGNLVAGRDYDELSQWR